MEQFALAVNFVTLLRMPEAKVLKVARCSNSSVIFLHGQRSRILFLTMSYLDSIAVRISRTLAYRQIDHIKNAFIRFSLGHTVKIF